MDEESRVAAFEVLQAIRCAASECSVEEIPVLIKALEILDNPRYWRSFVAPPLPRDVLQVLGLHNRGKAGKWEQGWLQS